MLSVLIFSRFSTSQCTCFILSLLNHLVILDIPTIGIIGKRVTIFFQSFESLGYSYSQWYNPLVTEKQFKAYTSMAYLRCIVCLHDL